MSLLSMLVPSLISIAEKEIMSHEPMLAELVAQEIELLIVKLENLLKAKMDLPTKPQL